MVFLRFLNLLIVVPMEIYNPSSNADTGKILFIGDISRVFLDTDVIGELPCQVYNDMPNAIKAAAKKNFQVIGVVISDSFSKLNSDLKTLRQLNPAAKIVLLAQMYEEPTAMQFVSPVYNNESNADDYLICPIHPSHLLSYCSSSDLRTTLSNSRITLLEKLATEDDLTGLKNRRYTWEFSRQVINYARKENEQVTLLVFDIDNFKRYNDAYGHSVGDKILKQAAVLMQCCCRSHDVVGRVGGDEFAVVFWEDPQIKSLKKKEAERRSVSVEHPKEAVFIAKRFRKELEKTNLGTNFVKESRLEDKLHLLGSKGRGVLTISGGLASFPRNGSTIQELFYQADNALLEAKRSGKNRIYLVGQPQNNIVNIE